jgi:hypothetical protein
VSGPVTEPKPSRADPSSRPGPSVTKLAGAASALILFASGVTALAFTLWPSLTPDPRSELGARATVLAVERNITVKEWLHRASSSEEDFAKRLATWEKRSGSTAIHGELAYVRLSVRGFKRRDVRFRWSIYKQSNQERREQGGAEVIPDSVVRLEAPVDDVVMEQWMGPVPGPELYFARFEVRTPEGALLDVADSKPFRGL